jgi:predicted enzyme related to lactoylglutathione lyase
MKLDSAVFYSNDIPQIVKYYTEEIGLELEYQQGEKYASFLLDDGVRLGIKKQSEEREVPGTQTIFLAVDDAEAEYEKAKEKKLDICKELVDQEWGIEFSVLDPDKNKVLFIQRKQS